MNERKNAMNELFGKILGIATYYGELKDAHLYDFKYSTVSVKTKDGKTITFTIDIKEEENDDAV